MHGHGSATNDLLGSAVPPPRLQSKQGTNSKYVSMDGNDFSSTSSKVSSFSVPQTPRSEGEILQSSNLKSFSFAELKMSTRDFCRDSVLGRGSFGSAFKGWIDEHTFAAAKPGTGMIIAVKWLSQKSFQGHKEWLAEVNYLGQLSHPHFVKLIGYCMEDEHRLLVYEFMPQGSLEGHLYRTSDPLSWNLRLKVALDAAKGLAFLHSAKVIYRDFKTSDILLDSSYNAKLSDFGLAKDGPTGNATHISTRVLGTYGYSAPEYSATGCCIESEFQFIQRIIKEISSTKLDHTQLFVAKHLVGIDSRAEAIELLLDTKSNDVRIVGIYGLGGVGKTTIAKAVYNRIFYRFERSYFLENVREQLGTNDGIIKVQKKLLSKIIGDKNLKKVSNIAEGIKLIMDMLCHIRILLILDDVDELSEIENLLGKCNWLASGSRVIITTRDKQVLTTLGKELLIYEVKKLNQCEACELLSLHAFQLNKPKEDYSKIVEQIIHYANGLPLALKIIGSDLCGKSICEWESALEKYKSISHKKILEKLKISYDALEKIEKDIFLNIACFFKGFHKDYVVNILDSCNLYPNYGIRKLVDKCLITVDEFGKLLMHDLLQQMGREIIQQESEEPRNRSRIWCYKDAYEVLTRNMGSNKIQGIMLYSPEPVTMTLQNEPFKMMENLKFLLVRNVRICEEFEYLPSGLRLLEWPEYPFSLPSKYDPQQLVALNAPRSCIRLKIFKQGIQLKNLKHINLSKCESITKLPELCAPNLETLDLSLCKNLVTIHESFGFLDKLQAWNLDRCAKLQNLPNSLRLKSLKEFFLTDCSSLEKFPDIHLEMKCLENLDLSGSGILELPSSIGYLTGLKSLDLEYCHNLRDVPDSIYKLQLLEGLYIPTAKLRPVCSSFDGFSGYGFLRLDCLDFRRSKNIIELDLLIKFDYFPALKHLFLSGTNIVSIPESISKFTTLEILEINNCKQLREIPRLPQSIRLVNAKGCLSLDQQSSSRLLNQIGEILGTKPNKECEGERSEILMDPQTLIKLSISNDEGFGFENDDDHRSFILPGTEIPKWFNSNHQGVGNSISFYVGHKFPNNFAVCFAVGLVPHSSPHACNVYLSINGYKKICIGLIWMLDEVSGHLWLCSRTHHKLQKQLNESNPSEQNYAEVIYEVNNTFEPRSWGVHVECICCPQNSNISYLPLLSARHSCGSSSIPGNTELPPLPLVSSTSYGSNLDHGAFNKVGDSKRAEIRLKPSRKPSSRL